VRNRRRVVYYAILLLLILGELLGEINYIIIIFPEYDSLPEKQKSHRTTSRKTNTKFNSGKALDTYIGRFYHQAAFGLGI